MWVKVLITDQFIHIFLTILDQWCYKFSEGYPNNISTTRNFRFSMFVLETFKFKKKQLAM